MRNGTIIKVTGREILDSRGNPTTEAEVWLADGSRATGSAPGGASTGTFEAVELRDGDKKRYSGKGVRKAAEGISTVIADVITGMDATDIAAIDRAMTAEDGTPDKSVLGANALLAVSIACCRAAAESLKLPLYRFLGGVDARVLPVPMMNILNGGAHAPNGIDIQEFMIIPMGAPSFSEGLRHCSEVYHALAANLKQRGFAAAVGDEGGFAPDMSETDALDSILSAVHTAGYNDSDFALALDAAASEWKTERRGRYRMPKSGREFSTAQLIEYWKKLCVSYPIVSLEDGLDEEDWDGWKRLTAELNIQLVGDDLFVTDTGRIEKGIALGCANAVLIKPNQNGTVTGTVAAARRAQESGRRVIVSHRSGETDDSFVADLAVALAGGQIKAGAPCRGERTAKYNRLLRIEEALGSNGRYAAAP